MKKLITLATVVVCFAISETKAQNVNGVKLSDIYADVIEVKAYYYNSSSYAIQLDYGQKSKWYRDATIKDDNGKDLPFNSIIEVVNKLKTYGYELFQTYTELTGKDSSRPVYILKKK